MVNLLRFITTYIFSPDRRWSAVTHNMKLLMVQAFPQEDLFRIWLSIGIFAVLAVWSIVSWRDGKEFPIPTYQLPTSQSASWKSHLVAATKWSGSLIAAWGVSSWKDSKHVPAPSFAAGIRNAGVLTAVVAIMHHSAEARTFGIPSLTFDAPTDWSSIRIWIFVGAVALAVLAQLVVIKTREADSEPSIPLLTIPLASMVAVAVLLWTVKLPVPLDQFDEQTAPIAPTTAGPWTALFIITLVAYLLGIMINRLLAYQIPPFPDNRVDSVLSGHRLSNPAQPNPRLA